jgi:transcriptional regulator with XRE-family HTH domain
MENENTTLADRIRERLEVVRKSAAAVSVEAGLGRSAVQDILAGHSSSPRLDTIQKLTGPLQCSLNYLVSGTEMAATPKDSKQPFRDLSLFPSVRDLESGVFRARVPLQHQSFERTLTWALEKMIDQPEYAVASDPRLPGFSIYPYRLLDHSLENIGIFKGDILMAASGFGDQIELKPGQMVILQHSLNDQKLDEWLVRVVEETEDGGFRLAPRSKDPLYQSYEISSATDFGSENTYSLNHGEWISVHAIVASIHRDAPIV